MVSLWQRRSPRSRPQAEHDVLLDRAAEAEEQVLCAWKCGQRGPKQEVARASQATHPEQEYVDRPPWHMPCAAWSAPRHAALPGSSPATSWCLSQRLRQPSQLCLQLLRTQMVHVWKKVCGTLRAPECSQPGKPLRRPRCSRGAGGHRFPAEGVRKLTRCPNESIDAAVTAQSLPWRATTQPLTGVASPVASDALLSMQVWSVAEMMGKPVLLGCGKDSRRGPNGEDGAAISGQARL